MVAEVLHMTGGVGKTSYANNSRLQQSVLIKARPSLEENLRGLYASLLPKCVMMADLGCSSGPNALMVLSEIIAVTRKTYRNMNSSMPELKVFWNDLPGNDFNTLFRSLPSFYRGLEAEDSGIRSSSGKCFVSGIPGSFYGRLFPSNFLHFAHSSYSINWLSQVPKGVAACRNAAAAVHGSKICVEKTEGPPDEYIKAYEQQFGEDFTLFLRSRSEEMAAGGRMVLTIRGSTETDDCMWDYRLLGMALNDMVSEGLISEDKFRGFNLPQHAPTAEEVKKLIAAEGSFALVKSESFGLRWDVQAKHPTLDLRTKAEYMAGTYRAAAEPLLISEFGEAIMDQLFDRFVCRIQEHVASLQEPPNYFNLVISMVRNDS
ncbi:hypothetical protein Nepgr_018103 [Nepenthes gracilis]|uniref:Uncharacterized protein n=1 Tax=Nepenthes gracilis TaxID=150966 RepID=A0AAD3STH9_NEPGR|nr:hypothetical protein Nepgr_018103 [Nepenthes gracilis]